MCAYSAATENLHRLLCFLMNYGRICINIRYMGGLVNMSNNIEKRPEYQEWYKKNSPLYSACSATAKNLIKTLLERKNALYHSIESRVKTEESFLNKCMDEKYSDPTSQITDLCGLRIITYTNHDVKIIRKIIEDEFQIDQENSIDKSEKMDDDQVGYLSIHYVVTLKKDRVKLSEYSIYENIKFEIQIRTLLQHAWAEIEHDRNYKFSGELPREIKRRFYLVAGNLELLDREFEQISEYIDQYADDVRREAEKGNLDVLIDSTSLLQYLSVKFKDYKVDGDPFNGGDKEIVAELQDFGMDTLKDLDEIIDDKFFTDYPEFINYIGLLRDIMMAKNPKKYFDRAWKNHWRGIDLESYKFIESINPDIENYIHMLDILEH